MERYELYVEQICSTSKSPHFDLSIVRLSDDKPPKHIEGIDDVDDNLARILNNLLLLHYQWECKEFVKWYDNLNIIQKAFYYITGELELPSSLLSHDMPSYYQASTGVYILQFLKDNDGKTYKWIQLSNCRQNQINYNDKQVLLNCFIEDGLIQIPSLNIIQQE